MKIAIIGAGAMGSLWGAKLSPLADVWLVDRWAEHVTTMQQKGLRVIGPDGEAQIVRVQATTRPEDVGRDVDLAIIFVKSPGTRWASQIAKTLLKPDRVALTMQNGLGNVETIAGVLGADRAVQGVTFHGATLVGPGRVRHAGAGATHLAIPAQNPGRLAEIKNLFEQAGFETHLSTHLDGLVWGKLVINAGINALTAILRIPNGLLLEIDSAGQVMVAAVAEAVRVAKAKEIELPYDDPVAQVRQVALATGSNRSSMLSDVVRRLPTEIDVINGAIVREGERMGLDTPVNQLLVWLVTAIEAGYELQMTRDE